MIEFSYWFGVRIFFYSRVHGSLYGSFWKACVNHIQVNQDILTITISEWMKDWYYNQTSITFTVKLKKNKKDLDSIDNKFKRHLIQGGPSQSFCILLIWCEEFSLEQITYIILYVNFWKACTG